MGCVSYSVANVNYEFQQTCSWQNVKEPSLAEGQSFLDFFREMVVTNTNLRASTRRSLFSTLKHLTDFSPGLACEAVTHQFILDFEQYLASLSQHKNTIAKHMKHLKTYVNLAIEEGLIDSACHPFHKYRIQTEEPPKSYLTPDELERIERLPLHGYYGLSRCRDIFLFSCYTGLRFSDIIQLTRWNFHYIDRRWWLVFSTQKTNRLIRLPLSLLSKGKSIAIFRKYWHNKEGGLFDLSQNSNSDINKLLKKLLRKARIDKPATFHSARHTFATLLLYKGAQITTVQRLLGHKSVRTTEIYSAIMDMTVIRDLKVVRKKDKQPLSVFELLSDNLKAR